MTTVITESDLPLHLKTITSKQWNNLFQFIPEIKQSKNFGYLTPSKKKDKNIIEFPSYVQTDVVSRFKKTIYDLGLIFSFDWPAWEEGRKILNSTSPDFEKLSIITLCKLITVIVRSNRFCDGTLIMNFKNGITTNILEAIKKQTQN